MHPKTRIKRAGKLGACLLAAAAIVAPQSARADQAADFVRAPATSSLPSINLAVSYEFNFRVAGESDLSDLLLQAGVSSDDVVAAARLAAGHVGGSSGCYAKVSVTKLLHESAFRLQRVSLMTETTQTVMERRKGELTISTTGARNKRSGII